MQRAGEAMGAERCCTERRTLRQGGAVGWAALTSALTSPVNAPVLES